MLDGYFLNRIFSYFKVLCERGTPGTMKQIFTLNTLMENECIEEKVEISSQVLELIDVQENLNIEVDELRLKLAAKDEEISHLKLKMKQQSSERPGASEELKIKMQY